jgi:co-chaperonin GroES (HSP10)
MNEIYPAAEEELEEEDIPEDTCSEMAFSGADLTELPEPPVRPVVDVKPTGYHILIEIPRRANQTVTGIVRPEKYRAQEQVASVLALVVEVGPDCFQDPDRFPSRRSWCQPGDTILIHAYTGSRFQIRSDDGAFTEYRILEDRHVLAVVSKESAHLVDRINAA